MAFRPTDSVGTRIQVYFAAQWLAYTLPCRRFADTLADACARLGADADRYSFIAVDLHHLLLAGLPARLLKNSKSHRRQFGVRCECNGECHQISAAGSIRSPASRHRLYLVPLAF